jgi:hypothetical protein
MLLRVNIGKGARDERSRPVGQDEEEVGKALAMNGAHDVEGLAFQRVARPDDPDRGRNVLDVGSVS